MNYDLKRLNKIIASRRIAFLLWLSIIAALMCVCLVFIILGINDTLTFLCIASEFIFIFLLYRLYCKYKPTVLFSREISGENIMEDEYIGVRSVNYLGRYRGFGGKVRLFHTGANRKPRVDGSIRSKVYLRLDDGSVTCLSDLYKSNTDVYIEGDTLIKYAGTKYPVVIGRDVERQPCPLCGEVNLSGESACHTCGLSIVN